MDYIVVLERTGKTPVTLRYLLRADVPLSRQPFYADAGLTSAYALVNASDLSDLRAGKVTERVESDVLSGQTVEQVKALLIAAQQSFQAQVSGAGENRWNYYGTSWDKAAWTVRGVS
jgi:hypothetical protein